MRFHMLTLQERTIRTSGDDFEKQQQQKQLSRCVLRGDDDNRAVE